MVLRVYPSGQLARKFDKLDKNSQDSHRKERGREVNRFTVIQTTRKPIKHVENCMHVHTCAITIANNTMIWKFYTH